MSQSVTVTVRQVSDSASEAVARGHHVRCDRPPAKGGQDAGPMGGELLLMGLGGCFMSNLLEAVKARGVDASELEVTVSAEMAATPPRFGAITLTVSGRWPDDGQMRKLLTIAERGCLCANTLKNALPLSVTMA